MTNLFYLFTILLHGDVIHKRIRICLFNKSDLGQWYWESQNKKMEMTMGMALRLVWKRDLCKTWAGKGIYTLQDFHIYDKSVLVGAKSHNFGGWC